ncbi:hypothetical protein [Methylobacterium sp. C1]|uniref:hypothetical protein n=1 Tax=Methylobacterium sp. C1 TaxID=1479019 RepID=UPI0013313C65|nr:hypothetical protein [Methylobacterium sp. C1]
MIEMLVSKCIDVRHLASRPCCLLETCHSTVVSYDTNFHLDHESNPDNPAIFLMLEGGGLLVPAQLPKVRRTMPDRFVFPLLITELEDGRRALKDCFSSLYVCSQRRGMDSSICIDRDHIAEWEKFKFVKLPESIFDGHPAQIFLRTVYEF